MPPRIHQPNNFPWTGEIIPWSAALHLQPVKGSRTLADLGRGERVKVIHRTQGWLYVERKLEGQKSSNGYVSGELIEPIALANAAAAVLHVPKAKADWQFTARKNAFGVGLAQQITNGTAWIPARGFAPSREIIARVYDYYGELCRRNPIKFQWAGLARMAGGPFFKGFCDMERARASTQATIDGMSSFRKEHYILEALRDNETRAAEAMADRVELLEANQLQYALGILVSMGKDIFDDLAWQHEAYLEKGLPEIRRLVDSQALSPDYYRAWEKIDSGKFKDVWEGMPNCSGSSNMTSSPQVI